MDSNDCFTDRTPVSDDQAAPLAELATAGGRDAMGRFTAGNREALIHGARSRQASALQAPVREEIRARVLSDLGADEHGLPATLLALVDRFAEVSLLCDAYFTWLQDQGGPIGTRGRQRAAVAGYLAALDRQMKLATLIGLERKPRRVPTLAEVMAHGE